MGDEPLVKAENQVRDYDVVKAHLIKEYGKPYDLVRVGLDEMEALPRPRNLDNNAKVYKALGQAQSQNPRFTGCRRLDKYTACPSSRTFGRKRERRQNHRTPSPIDAESAE